MTTPPTAAAATPDAAGDPRYYLVVAWHLQDPVDDDENGRADAAVIEAIGDYDKVLALNRLMFVAVRGHPMQQVIYGAIDAINRIQFGERIRFVVSSARPREEQWAGRTTSWAEINFVTRNVKPSPTTPSE